MSPQTNGKYKYTQLHSFNGGGGEDPSALILDGAGNLYGAAHDGGIGMGLIFELNPNANWDETVIYEFTEALGGEPVSPLTFDAAGNLYGTATYGGAGGGGVVFEVTP
ncbi:MAG: choice-of-anchor tandem repeat GloVer-containing protein [Candidatus Sulfotelmatobacter sp.]